MSDTNIPVGYADEVTSMLRSKHMGRDIGYAWVLIYVAHVIADAIKELKR